MPSSNKRSFDEICKKDAKAGYVLDKSVWIEDKTITAAVKMISGRINECDKQIKIDWGRNMQEFYIGKSFIRSRKGTKVKFDPKRPTTWRLDGGINGRYTDHHKEDYGKNGLIVVAVVTKESLTETCKSAGYIVDQEEYALALEKRLIQKFKDDDRLANKKQYSPGKHDIQGSIAYAVYIAFSMESEDDDTSSDSTASSNPDDPSTE